MRLFAHFFSILSCAALDIEKYLVLYFLCSAFRVIQEVKIKYTKECVYVSVKLSFKI